MFGFDLTKMLGGGGDDEGKGGGGFIMNMIMKQLAAPGTQKMITGKIDEMFAHLAGTVNCKKENLALLLKLENVPAKDEKGVFLLEEGPGGVSAQKFEQKAIIYVMVDGKAAQKIAIDQFLAMMQDQGGG